MFTCICLDGDREISVVLILQGGAVDFEDERVELQECSDCVLSQWKTCVFLNNFLSEACVMCKI